MHGLLRTLQHVGFVEQDRDSDKYQLGAGLLHLQPHAPVAGLEVVETTPVGRQLRRAEDLDGHLVTVG